MSTAAISPLLRQAAPHLSQHFFSCARCINRPLIQARFQSSHAPSATQHGSVRRSPFLQAFKSQTASVPAAPATGLMGVLESLNKSLNPQVSSTSKQSKAKARSDQDRAKNGHFPRVTSRSVSLWLYASAASVFGIVVFGALTRLTESGLSITEWRPVTGSLPPLNDAAWDVEFSKYRRSPEFQQLNSNMTLSDFKRIYWMEYTHRLWGRVIGLATLLPTVYFIYRKKCSRRVARNLILINLLIVAQGAVGWWMVKSGLHDDLYAKGSHPRVSQYRLTTHLGMAFSVYVAMIWNALSINRERSFLERTPAHRAELLLQRMSAPALRPLRIATGALAALIFTTAMSGGLVAGLDAGLIYNEFPWMGLGLTPPKSELWDSWYSRDPNQRDLWWRNLLENPSLVQLDHRILATTTFLALNGLFAYARYSPAVRTLLTKSGKMALSSSLVLVWLQVTMGITTLLYLVPTPLAAGHQAGSLALLTSIVVLGSRVWTPARLKKLVDFRVMKLRAAKAKQAALREERLRKKPFNPGPKLF